MQTVDFDQVDDVYKASPGWWGIIADQEDELKDQLDLDFELKEQYIKLNNLGIDYLIQYDTVHIRILTEFLHYINDNYITLTDFTYIELDQVQIFAKCIYDILFVDMINDTIPQICNVKKIDDPIKLIQADVDETKQILLEHYNETLKSLNSLYKINPSLGGVMVKNSFAIDLFSMDISQWYEEFFVPVVTNYTDQIQQNI